eukprot:7569586-Pyramimonas_sp.AAC.1
MFLKSIANMGRLSARGGACQIAQTMNRLANRRGSSPAQWISMPIPWLLGELLKGRSCGADCDCKKLVRMRSTSQPTV